MDDSIEYGRLNDESIAHEHTIEIKNSLTLDKSG